MTARKLRHLSEDDMDQMMTEHTGLAGRISAIETWRANRSAAVEKLSANPSVSGVTVLGFVVPTKASIDTHIQAIHAKINDMVDIFTAREITL